MSTKLLAGLLAMILVAGVGIYAGVTKFYTPDATPISGDSDCTSCCSAKAKLPISAQVTPTTCCPGDDATHEEEGCCAAKAAKTKTQYIGVAVGGMGLAVEPKPTGCAKCKEEACDK